MAESKSRLPAIAIALAIVAAGMLTGAIVMRSRKARDVAPPPHAGAAIAPIVDAAPPVMIEPDAEIGAFVPDLGASDAGVLDPGDCIPCAGCKATTCRCADNSVVSSYHCRNGCCLSATATCDVVCASRNGASRP